MIDDSILVNQTILHYNQKHFGQVQDIFFIVPSLSEHTDFTGTKNQNGNILQNIYSNSNLNNTTLKLLYNLYTPLSIPRTKKLTKKQFEQNLSNWKKNYHYISLRPSYGLLY